MLLGPHTYSQSYSQNLEDRSLAVGASFCFVDPPASLLPLAIAMPTTMASSSGRTNANSKGVMKKDKPKPVQPPSAEPENTNHIGKPTLMKIVYINRNDRVWPASVLACSSNEWSMEELDYRVSYLPCRRTFAGVNMEDIGFTLLPVYIGMVQAVDDDSGASFKLVGRLRRIQPVTLHWVRQKIRELGEP